MKTRNIVVLVGFLFICSGTAVQAQVIQAKVVRTLVADEGRWGECMAFLGSVVQEKAPSCAADWVTFSCDGTYTTKDVAARMFDTAQLALALNKTVAVYVSAGKRHNRYCYVNRIDLLND